MGNATSIFNLMRNIGASIGISMVENVQYGTADADQCAGAPRLSGRPGHQRMFQGLRGYFMIQGADPVTAAHRAYGAMWGLVQQQAAMLAYNDTFRFMAGMFVIMIPFVFWMKRPRRGKPAMAH